MLNKIRKPSLAAGSQLKKFFAYLFFGLICFILVLFMPITSRLTGGGSVIQIGKQSISSREYNLVIRNLKAQYADRLNKAKEAEIQRLESQIQQRALDQLINIYVISQGAEKEGFFVANRAVQEEVQSFPVFQEGGRFIYSRYREILKNQKLPPGEFETRIRRQILIQDWRNIFFTAFQANALEKDKGQNPFKIKVRFASLDESLEISLEKQLRSFLEVEEKHQEASRLLKNLNLKWKTTNEFSPSFQRLFELDNNETLLKAVLSYIPKKGFLPRLVSSKGRQYVAEILSFRQEEEEKKAVDFNLLLNYEKPLRFFENWLKDQKDNTPIQINKRYLNNATTPN